MKKKKKNVMLCLDRALHSKISVNFGDRFAFYEMDIKPCVDESKPLYIYCNTEIAVKHYDLVRLSETKKHKKESETLYR